MAAAIIREDILQKFPDLFGTKNVNGREVNIERTIATLTQELRPEIAAALTARRMLLAVTRTGPREICLAEVGRHVRGSCNGAVLDISPDRPRPD